MAAEEVSKGAMSLLPKSNPVCVHDWNRDPCRMVFYCSKCEYELTYLELVSPKEGEDGDNDQ